MVAWTRVRSWPMVVGLGLLSAGCALDGIFGSRKADLSAYAVATYLCGIAGGIGGVEIFFGASPMTSGNPPPPYVGIRIWQSGVLQLEIDEGHWRIGEAENVGASYFLAPTFWEGAEGGDVVVSTMLPDTMIAGSVDLTFPSLDRFETDFEAAWVPMIGGCL